MQCPYWSDRILLCGGSPSRVAARRQGVAPMAPTAKQEIEKLKTAIKAKRQALDDGGMAAHQAKR